MPKRKKLLMITNTLSTFGGGERWALELAKRIRGSYEVTFANPVSRSSTERMTDAQIARQYGVGPSSIINLQCHGIRRKAFSDAGFLLMAPSIDAMANLYRAISKSDVVYILSLNPIIFYLSVKFAKMANKPIILGVHNPFFADLFNDSGGFYANLYRNAFNSVDVFHVINGEDWALVRRHYPSAKVFLIPNFITVKPKSKPMLPTRFTVLFVGRLEVHHKGVDLMSQIIDETLRRNKDVHFHIAGSGSDGEQLVRRMAQKYPRNVSWKGFLTGKALDSEYDGASLLMFTSRFESFGLSLLEAQVRGLPAVAFNVKGPKDIIRRPFQGTLVSGLNVRRFSDAILAYYKRWSADRRRYADANRKMIKYVMQNYSDKRIVPEIVKMLDSTRLSQ